MHARRKFSLLLNVNAVIIKTSWPRKKERTPTLMNIKYMTPGELVPYDKNPRINDQAVDLVANSIRELGFKQPIVIDRNNVIIAGHTRWKAAREL